MECSSPSNTYSGILTDISVRSRRSVSAIEYLQTSSYLGYAAAINLVEPLVTLVAPKAPSKTFWVG